MAESMKAISQMTACTVRVCLNKLITVFIRAPLRMVINTGMESSLFQMADLIKDSGKIICSMGKETFLIPNLKINPEMAYGKTENAFSGQMVKAIAVSFPKVQKVQSPKVLHFPIINNSNLIKIE